MESSHDCGSGGRRSFSRPYTKLTDERVYGSYERWWDIDSLLDKLNGPLGTSAWQAVGRSDLTFERVATATDAFLRAVLSG